jgi:CubicO group peptidase (beta-lactamase class C family)
MLNNTIMRYLIYLLAFSPLATFAQKLESAKLDSVFDLIEEYQKGMGFVHLAQNGETIYSRAFGFAYQNKAGEKRLIDENTRFRIGSISKSFTAVLAMQMLEAGALKLDDKLAQWYPLFPGADSITIAMLLSHRSGLHNFTNDPSYFQFMETSQSKSDMIGRLKDLPLDFDPGSQQVYSNTNFLLLSYILEDISGESYATLLNSKITEPLNLESTYYGGDFKPNSPEAYSYSYINEWQPSSFTDPSIPQGAGGIVSTPAELSIFFRALFSGKLVSEESLRLMLPEEGESLGMGLQKLPFYQHFAYGHNGSIDAFLSSAFYFPEEDLNLSICLNGQGYPLNNIAIAVLSSYFDQDYDLPNFKKLEVEAEKLAPLTGTYQSEQIPLDLRIFIESGELKAQATKQGAFPLEAKSDTVFTFDAAGIKIEFEPKENKLLLLQNGMRFEFTKQ